MTVLREGGEDELEAHKRRRLAEKGMHIPFRLFYRFGLDGKANVSCGWCLV